MHEPCDTSCLHPLDLVGATKLGSGAGRDCFVHPHDSSQVVKVSRADLHAREQNLPDYLYLRSLSRRKVPFDHISKCYGLVDTNLGKGFDL